MNARRIVCLSFVAVALLALLPMPAAADLAGPKPTMHVGNIRMRYVTIGGLYRVIAAVPVRDGANLPVPGVGVTVEWTLPNGNTLTQQAPTNASGIARFRVQTPQTGVYKIEVLDLAKSGYVYDPGANFETSETITVP